MHKTMKITLVAAAVLTMGIFAGCGGSGGGSGTTAGSVSPSTGGTSTTPPSTTAGANLYAANCAGCHGAVASTSIATPTSLTAVQDAIAGNIGGMGMFSSLSTADLQSIVDAVNNPSGATTPPPPPTTTVDGPALYASRCAACHGPLATSGKRGTTLARLQTAIAANSGGMGGLSTLTAAELQAIVTALNPTTTTPPPVVTDGPTLYASNCAACHGPLATSTKAGRTAAQIQAAITNGIGGMGSLTSLTTTQVSAIATALASVTTTPPPAPACGSCHAIPPSTGKHAYHSSRATCATCHGTGYSTTSVNAATHNNGVKNLTTTIGWTASSRSCSNSCHGRKSW